MLSSSAAHQPACWCSACSPPPTTGCLSCSGGAAGGGWAVLQGDSSGLSSHSPYAANAATRQQQDVKLVAAIACWRLPEADGSTSSSDRRIRSNSPASVSNIGGSSASTCGTKRRGPNTIRMQHTCTKEVSTVAVVTGVSVESAALDGRRLPWSCSHLCPASASLPVSRKQAAQQTMTTTRRRRRRAGGRLPPHPSLWKRKPPEEENPTALTAETVGSAWLQRKQQQQQQHL